MRDVLLIGFLAIAGAMVGASVFAQVAHLFGAF
jgi:hypothetical protein